MNREGIYSQQWRMTASYGEEKTVMSLVVAALEQQLTHARGLAHRLEDVRTVLAEACINAIEYGDGTPITVKLHIDSQQFELEIINVVKLRQALSQQPTSATQLWKKENPRGWGLLLIHQLCDKTEYGYIENSFYIKMRFFIEGERYGPEFSCDNKTTGQGMDY